MTTKTQGICGQKQADGTICTNAAGCSIPHPRSDLSEPPTQTKTAEEPTGGYSAERYTSEDDPPSGYYEGGYPTDRYTAGDLTDGYGGRWPGPRSGGETRDWNRGEAILGHVVDLDPTRPGAEERVSSLVQGMAAVMTEHGHKRVTKVRHMRPGPGSGIEVEAGSPEEADIIEDDDSYCECDGWAVGGPMNQRNWDAAHLFHREALIHAMNMLPGDDFRDEPDFDAYKYWDPDRNPEAASKVVAALAFERILRGEYPVSEVWNWACESVEDLRTLNVKSEEWIKYEEEDYLRDPTRGRSYEESMRTSFAHDWEYHAEYRDSILDQKYRRKDVDTSYVNYRPTISARFGAYI